MSGIDVARWTLRAVIGGTMIAHGVRHGRTLDGTAGWFGSIGFVLNLGAASVALAALGPGRFSVDRARGLDGRLSGPQRAALAAGLGLAGAAAQLAAFWRRPQPKPVEGEAKA